MYKIIGADGQEYGPVTLEQLRQWITEGRADAQTQAQAVGTSDWKSLKDFPEFGPLFAAPVPTTAPPAAPAAQMTTPPAPQQRLHVPNHLVWAILSTLFCCLPFGIVAIVFAAQVNSKLQAGDVAGALESSRKAKIWCWASVAGWLVVCVIYLLFFGLFAARRVSIH